MTTTLFHIKISILFFILVFTILSCINKPNANQKIKFTNKEISMENNEENNQLVEETISIIPFDIQKHWMIFKTGENYSLTKSDLQLIDSLLQNKVDAYNAIEKVKFEKRKMEFPHLNLQLTNYTLNLDDYKRQYLAVTTNGEIKVYVNCLCNVDHKNWKNEMIDVLDGGKCYFNTTINITDTTCSDLSVNGES